MKAKTLIIILLLFGNLVYSQNCDAIIEENNSLKAQLGINTVNPEVQIKSFNDKLSFKILSCKGNTDAQTVEIKFIVSHNLVHQSLAINFNSSKAYDIAGNEFPGKSGSLGTTTNGWAKIPTSIPLQGTITFKNILPSVAMFKFITLPFGMRNFDGAANQVRGNTEIKDLKIEW